MMKFKIAAGYQHGERNVRVIEIALDTPLPYNFAPGTVCDECEAWPQVGEQLWLGKSDRGHFPDDVIVTRIA